MLIPKQVSQKFLQPTTQEEEEEEKRGKVEKQRKEEKEEERVGKREGTWSLHPLNPPPPRPLLNTKQKDLVRAWSKKKIKQDKGITSDGQGPHPAGLFRDP